MKIAIATKLDSKFNGSGKTVIIILICSLFFTAMGALIFIGLESKLVRSIIDDAANIVERDSQSPEFMNPMAQFRQNSRFKLRKTIFWQVWILLISVGVLAAALVLSFKKAMDRYRNNFQHQLQEPIKYISENITGLKQVSGRLSKAPVLLVDDTRWINMTAEHIDKLHSTIYAATESMEMMSRSIEQLAQTLSEMTQQSDDVFNIAADIISRSQKASVDMHGLKDVTHKINGVMAQMTEISAQIDLLVINAIIESDRVNGADAQIDESVYKIKTLAKQTVAAAQKITDNVGKIQKTTWVTAAEIGLTLKIINKISSISAQMTTSLHDQSTNTRGIAANLKELSFSLDKVVATATQNPAPIFKMVTAQQNGHPDNRHLAEISSQINHSVVQIEHALVEFEKIMLK